MISALLKLVSALAFVAGVAAQGAFTINTPPNVVVCEPTQLTWSGGVAPYFLSILPGGQPGAPALVDLGQQNGTSTVWVANLAAGTSIFLNLRGTDGTVAQSAPFTINPGPDTSCVGKPASSTPGGPAPATPGTPAPAGPTAPAAGTTAPAATGSTSTGSKSGASTAATATKPASSSNAAIPSQGARMGAAGIVGAAVIALLA